MIVAVVGGVSTADFGARVVDAASVVGLKVLALGENAFTDFDLCHTIMNSGDSAGNGVTWLVLGEEFIEPSWSRAIVRVMKSLVLVLPLAIAAAPALAAADCPATVTDAW